MSVSDTGSPAATDPLRAAVSVKLGADATSPVAAEAREHRFALDEPASAGGADAGATPLEYLLAALGGCQVISARTWAGKLGLRVDAIDVELTGDIDMRGFLGLDEDVRPGFGGIDVNLVIRGPEPPERYDELIAKVEEHCPVLDNLTVPVPVTLRPRVTVAAAA